MFGNCLLNAAMYVSAVAVSVGVQPHQLMVPDVALEASLGLSEPPQAARETASVAAARAASARFRVAEVGRRRIELSPLSMEPRKVSGVSAVAGPRERWGDGVFPVG